MHNRLKGLREEHELTLRELGKQLDMHTNTLSQYETGKRNPKPEISAKDKCKYCTFDANGYGANMAGNYKDCELRLCEVGEHKFKIYAFAPAHNPLAKDWTELYST